MYRRTRPGLGNKRRVWEGMDSHGWRAGRQVLQEEDQRPPRSEPILVLNCGHVLPLERTLLPGSHNCSLLPNDEAHEAARRMLHGGPLSPKLRTCPHRQQSTLNACGSFALHTLTCQLCHSQNGCTSQEMTLTLFLLPSSASQCR